MTALRAKLFNEENLIKKKMSKMQKDYEDKIGELQRKINNLQTELAKVTYSINFSMRHTHS
jgi:flagellar hook-associated protein FlgK